MSKFITSSAVAAFTLAVALVSIQAPASANSWSANCSDPGYAQKNIFRCMQLNGN